ncbi:MAG: hypothetical protein II375_06240 [Bacteroidales bacterium]|nr:hypothetical protein [Bacteroidales bacterium]
MDRIYQLLGRVRRFVETHWRMVVATLCMIVVLQQCTINRLNWEIEQIATRRPDSPSQSDTLSGGGAAVVATADTLAPDSLRLHSPSISDAGGQSAERSFPWILALAGGLVVGIGIYVFYAVRTARFPFGVAFRSKLRQPQQGQVVFHIKISNRSPKTVDLSDAQVNFMMGVSRVRRFRANVPTLPITLQPHTSFEAQINLTGLIGANLELFQAKAISMSVGVDGKMHNTMPHRVSFRQA